MRAWNRFIAVWPTKAQPRLVAAAKNADVLRLLSRVLGRAEQLDLEHSITVVERGRIRRRALPIP